MFSRIVALSLIAVAISPLAYGNTVHMKAVSLNQAYQLPALPPGTPGNNGFSDVLGTAVLSDSLEGTVVAEVTVEVRSFTSGRAICQLAPKSFLGGQVDPALTPVEFSIESPMNIGGSPAQISATTTVTRISAGKTLAGARGIGFVLRCKRFDNTKAVALAYASLKLTSTSDR